MTRPTRERIEEIRNCPGCDDRHRDDLLAEIDALTAERDGARVTLSNYRDQSKELARLRAMLATAREGLEHYSKRDPDSAGTQGEWEAIFHARDTLKRLEEMGKK